MTPEQMRMARAGLRLTLRDLSTASSISVTTLNNMEYGRKVRPATVDVVASALQNMGVAFVDDGRRVGVAIDRSEVDDRCPT